jgi:hypothetical protein
MAKQAKYFLIFHLRLFAYICGMNLIAPPEVGTTNGDPAIKKALKGFPTVVKQS